MWQLISAALVLPLILNSLRWRGDRRRLAQLAAPRHGAPPAISGVRVSFLVAAWNEEANLRACIESILRLRDADLEIVLCAGGTDRTWEIASQLRDTRVILLQQNAGEGKQKSLRRCLERATGEILYLLDADCRITSAAFETILNPILSGAEMVVTAIPCTPFPEDLSNSFVLSQSAGRAYTSFHQPEYCPGLSGANSAIRRAALEKAGGFVSVTATGVDYDLGQRLLRSGARIRYRQGASLPIRFHTRMRPYLRQQARWLRNVVVLGVRFGNYREVISCLCTSAIGLSMLVTPLVWLFPAIPPNVRKLTLAFWLCAFLHAWLSRLRYSRIAARLLEIRMPARTSLMVPLFLVLDFVAWAIPLGAYPWRATRDRW